MHIFYVWGKLTIDVWHALVKILKFYSFLVEMNMKKYDLCVIGLGYIGIPTAAIFASKHKKVLGVDVLASRVDLVNAGKRHVGEADIDAFIARVVAEKFLKASTLPESSDTYIVAVPTPFKRLDGGRKIPDLSFVESATRSIAGCIENSQMVVLESTSPVGTIARMRGWLKDELSKIGRLEQVDFESIDFVHCPERILPGKMLSELVSNDRICGGFTPAAAERAKALYACFCQGEIFTTDDKTAEMAKLTENASRDVAIAFANELSIVCDKFGIDVWELIRLANRHPRVNILSPGPGVGGHCIAVDPWFIISDAENETPLMRAARMVNDGKPDFVLKKVREAANAFRSPTIACLGITFKANVNDIRESPALEIVSKLCAMDIGTILVADPHVETLPSSIAGKAQMCSPESAVSRADIVLLLVDHREFSSLSGAIEGKVLIDTKGFFKKS